MARGQERDDSVYDFLYVDARRVAHFLSQFGQYGHLTLLTRSATETSTSGGGLNVQIAKLDSSTAAQTTQARQFDPQWIAPLSFLDQAGQKGMLVRGLSGARIGQLVLITGELAIFDLSIIKSVWGISPMRAMLTNSLSPAVGETSSSQRVSRQGRRRSEREGSGDKSLSPAQEASFELLKTLPHAVVAAMHHGDEHIWSNLREDSLMVAAADLLMKHGVRIAGNWAMVGILDALPDGNGASEKARTAQNTEAALSLGSLGALIGPMGPAIRGILGRPTGSYGMTPILIFREVSA